MIGTNQVVPSPVGSPPLGDGARSAEQLRMRAVALAIELLGGRAQALEQGLRESQRDFAFPREDPVGARALHHGKVSQVGRAREDVRVRIQRARLPDDLVTVRHAGRGQDQRIRLADIGRVQRVGAGGRFQPTELGKPVRGMNDPVPAGMRNSREEMIRIALTYPEGLRVGNFTDGGTPFAEGAYRVENGVITADQTDPRRRMYEQNIIVHPGIISSVAAVDEENGTVLLWMNFGHTGDSYGVGNALIQQ